VCVVSGGTTLPGAGWNGAAMGGERDPRTTEKAMTGGPHLYAMTIVNERRRTELLAEGGRNRLARLARPGPDRRPRWSDAVAVFAVVLALALLAASALVA
jgi:hypothetical protein